MLKEKAGSGSRAHSRRSSASMSLQSAIPRRVALQQRTPLLHRLQSACDRLTLPVNRYGNDGNIAEPVNFNRPPEPPGGQTENRDFHLGIAENCPNNRDHRSHFDLLPANSLVNHLCPNKPIMFRKGRYGTRQNRTVRVQNLRKGVGYKMLIINHNYFRGGCNHGVSFPASLFHGPRAIPK